MASTEDVQVSTKTQNLAQGFLSGEGFFVLNATGKGIVFVSSYGVIHPINLDNGEEYDAKLIGADTLGYIPEECLGELIGGETYCSACFTGDYPTAIPSDVRKDRFERRLSEIQK